MEWKIPIHEAKNSEKILAFANSGYGMSKEWWEKIYNYDQNGLLWGVYRVPSGLRRTII